MASKVSTGITWSSSSSVTVSSATLVTSDSLSFNVDDWDGEVQVSVDNQGTPASGDVCDVYIAYTTGDVLGDSGDDFATSKNAEFLFRLDTFSTNPTGEDPASRSMRIRTGPKGFRLVLSCPNAATRNMVVRAMLHTHRSP